MGKTDRKLTKAEEKRKKIYEEEKQKLIEDGYTERDLTIGIVYANVMAFVLGLPIIIVLGIFFFKYNLGNSEVSFIFTIKESMVFLISLWVLIVVHELIHGAFWAIFAKEHLKSIEFGFIVQYLTPYCCCKEVLTKGQYIIGGIMPTVLLGLVPAVVAIFSGSWLVFVIGCIMILSGGGDMTIVLKLIMYRSQKQDILYMDHPYECGLVVFER
ncbi:DUF3267 domain-containing protein [Intestinibacter sp.]|uniref:DUF3267 domain-containing protein n=1 Tax=Intestinibacter sp. TaxID=1965304 RepID=UPI003F17A204